MTTLPRWIWVGTGLLAFVAGMINVVGFLSISQQAVTHLTGTTSLFAIAVIEHDTHHMLLLGAILLAFFFGSLTSGLMIQDHVLRFGKRYGAVLMLESLILVLATLLLQRHHMAGLWLAERHGHDLQQSGHTHHASVWHVYRPRHFSWSGVAVEPRRLMLCLVVISAFFCGGLAGAVSFQEIGYNTLLIPAGLTGLTGVSYMLLRWYALRPNK